MLTFSEVVKRQADRYIFLEQVYHKVLARSQQFGKLIAQNKFIVCQGVQQLVDYQLNQTSRDKEAMDTFVYQFDQLSDEQKNELVKDLAKPLPGENYIESNNQTKLLLIYKHSPNSQWGRNAFEAIILNKQRWFEVIASKAAAAGRIPHQQAKDYAQEMTLTLLGGGYYNERNGGKFSINAYDPYSGVPFNKFVNTYIVNSAHNKFSDTYNKSITNDFGYSDKMSVTSIDAPINDKNLSDDKQGTLVDTMVDTTAAGAEPSEAIADRQEQQMLKKFLQDPSLNDKQRTAIKMRYGIEGNDKDSSFLEIGLALGYPKSSALQNGRRITMNAQSKLKKLAKNFKKD